MPNYKSSHTMDYRPMSAGEIRKATGSKFKLTRNSAISPTGRTFSRTAPLLSSRALSLTNLAATNTSNERLNNRAAKISAAARNRADRIGHKDSSFHREKMLTFQKNASDAFQARVPSMYLSKVMPEQKPHSTQLYRGQANFQSPTTAFGKAKLALLVAKDDIRSGERAASTVQKDLIKKGLSSTRASAFVQKHNKSFSGAGSGLNSAQIARANRHGLSSLVGGGSGGGQPRVPAGSPAGGQFARK